MKERKKWLVLVIKTLLLLLIPYNLINSSTRTSSTSAIIGTWGQWPVVIMDPGSLDQFWITNQFLISLAFILPLVLFSVIFQERDVDKIYAGSAIFAASISFTLTLIVPFQIGILPGIMMVYPFNVIPSVVTLAIFIFIFWPLLQKSWPTFRSNLVKVDTKNFKTKVEYEFRRIVPNNLATAIWIALFFVPTVLSLTNLLFSEEEVRYSISLFGSIFGIYHEYILIDFPGGGYYPVIYSTTILAVAYQIAIVAIILSSVNLWLGITAMRYIQGKSTKKRIYILVIVSILLSGLPVTLIGILSLLFGGWLGPLSIPIPVYQIFILLIAKHVKAPSPDSESSEVMIKVPLRTRLSMLLHKKPTIEEDDIGQEDMSE
ncbi:MAG: hypothetical protein JW779_03810 [Candidatus Thorarchaeota archaeon]|nr:hypothetical protein [Candidatus Thorarchaeota archaeon]